MLAPAMHTCSDAFYTHPENKVVADKYGIMITTSHTIYNKLDARVAEAAQYENIYSMAMRGLHDEGMRGDMPLQEKVEVLHYLSRS